MRKYLFFLIGLACINLTIVEVQAKAAICRDGNCGGGEQGVIEDDGVIEQNEEDEIDLQECDLNALLQAAASGDKGKKQKACECAEEKRDSNADSCDISALQSDLYLAASDVLEGTECASSDHTDDILDAMCTCTQEKTDEAVAGCDLSGIVKQINFGLSDLANDECADPNYINELKQAACDCTADLAQTASKTCDTLEMQKAYHWAVSDMASDTTCVNDNYRNNIAADICGCQSKVPDAKVDYNYFCSQK